MNRIQSHHVFQAVLGLLVSTLLVGEAAGQTRTFTVSVSAASIAENGGTSTFTVAVNTAFATDQPILLDYNEGTASTSGTLAGGDFRLASTSLTLRAGETSVSTTVFAIDDRNDDDDETILISAIHNGSVVGTRQTITIIDDDEPPLLAVSLSHTYLIEGVDDGLTLTLRYSNNTVFETRGAVTITLSGTAENKDDYEEPEELQFDFRSSDTEKTVFFALIDDMMDEGTETIIIEVEQNDRNNDVKTTLGTWTVKIGPSVVFSLLEESDRTLLENGDENEHSLLVLRSDGPVDEEQRVTLTFGGTATKGEDYRTGSTLSISVGGISVGRNLTPLDDDLREGDETIEITAWHYGRDIGTETITIIDDESDGGTDVTPPALTGATVNSSTLVLTYDEALDGGSMPSPGNFSVTAAGSPITVTGVSVAGSTVTLTLATAVEANQAVALAYTPGANPIQDAAGNDAALLSRQTVTNNTADVTPPTLSGATVNSSTLVLTYDEMLDGASVPATGDFVMTVDGSAITVTGVSVAGSTVTLTLATAVEAGQTVTLAYTPRANPIQDAAENAAAPLSRQTVTNNTSAQTRQILVSNSDSSVSSNANDRYAAQGFVTGSSSYGYTVSEVRIRFGLNLETVTTAVKIQQNNNGLPGALVATLTNPNSFANDSFNTFTAPADTHLDPNTKYFFTINEGVVGLGRIYYSVTTNTAESGLTGWSVDDDRLWRSSEGATSWNTSTASLIFEIRGTTVSPPPPPPPPPGGGGGGGRGTADNFPTADAGTDQLGVWEGALVTLDGSGSSDPDDDPLRYRWNQLSGEPVVLSSQNIVNPTFTAPQGLTTDAVLRFRLLVTDPSSRFDSDTVTITVEQGSSPPLTEDRIYYFPHLAVGASWQTTITYINYSREEVTCQTDFISDHGTPLMVSFAELGTVDSRTDVLPPGGSVHQETDVDLSAPLAPGWALANCSGPVKASLLYRQHNSEGAPTAEAGANAAAVPATRFVTFAEQGEGQFGTGVAYANPSDTSATVTFTARDAAGEVLASVDRTLLPGGHDAHGMGALFGPTSFTGSIEVTSTEPIVSLSLNFEADPVFSSLPPGELDASAQGSTTYYFPHLAVGASWQTTITYINYSREEVTCQTDFISDHGTPLMVSFAELGTVDSRTDVLPPGGSVHQETNVDLNASLAPGWARANCSGPVKASLLFRLHNSEGAPTAEAGVNAAAVPATRFVTFAEQGEDQFGTGVAYANPFPNISVPVTFTARDAAGEVLASVVRTLLPGGHDAHGMAELFGLISFSGSIEVTSTEPIVSLSLNFEAAPVFSSLPPGEVDAAAQ